MYQIIFDKIHRKIRYKNKYKIKFHYFALGVRKMRYEKDYYRKIKKEEIIMI